MGWCAAPSPKRENTRADAQSAQPSSGLLIVSLPHPCPDKTLADLEWDRLLASIADRCKSATGKDRARSWTFAETREEIARRLAEAEEALHLLRAGAPLPARDVPDVRESIDRLRVGGALGAAELRASTEALAGARSLRRFLQSRKGGCPALSVACATDPTLDDVEQDIAHAFDADGTLSDRASPRLRELRGEYQASRARMLSRLEEMMNRYEGILQDHFVTEREGRYVVPVRSDAYERFPGIVHATSGSGSTLFVEPRIVVPLGNRLKMLEAEVAREVLAIQGRLSALLADVLPSFEAAISALALADVLGATAELAQDIGLTFPSLVDEPRLNLVRARHPLLLLDALPPEGDAHARTLALFHHIVPSDLVLESGHALVVSGPNAGGKTVALKATGLAVLMVRAGLPVACGEGSVVGIFEIVLTDVGDEQNLAKTLSTFSAHVQNLAGILEETRRGALVLLDELAGGTDPREGEALAAGVLDSLCARGGAVIATTHYEGLKALAFADPRFQNASVGFDVATMTPTFRLTLGIPGSSSALLVAARHHMPSTVIERAQRFLSREDQSFESLVTKLHAERAALELAREAAVVREEEARAVKERLLAELEQAKDREKRAISREAEALLASLRRAKEDLRAAQAKLRNKKIDESALREAARAIDLVASQATLGGELESVTMRNDEAPPLRREELKRGTKVYVPRLRAEAEVLELTADRAKVAVGPMKLTVSLVELRAALPSASAEVPVGRRFRARVPGAALSPPGGGLEAPIETEDNTCDLRGLRADDAVPFATSFLDRALQEGHKVVFLVHGHGTGALRDAIRRELRQSAYVARFRGGETEEGGDGVTVVWLA
jgi:DNA mismatch repair protein MutS2